jgi:hypothetical protein
MVRRLLILKLPTMIAAVMAANRNDCDKDDRDPIAVFAVALVVKIQRRGRIST